MNILHGIMLEQELLHLCRVDVLSASDDHVFGSSYNRDGSVVVHHGNVSSVIPAVLGDFLLRLLLTVPVAPHDRVSTNDNFSLDSTWHNAVALINDSSFEMIHDVSDGLDALLRGVVTSGHEGYRRGFRGSVAHLHVSHVHVLNQSAAERDWTRSSCDESGSDRVIVVIGVFGMVDHVDEHGRGTVQGSALLLVDRFESSESIERWRREDTSLKVSQCGEDTHDTPKTVIEWVRNADDGLLLTVSGTEAHEEGVVQYVVMGESGSFRLSSGSRGVLDVQGVVWLCLPLDLRQLMSVLFSSHLQHISVSPCSSKTECFIIPFLDGKTHGYTLSSSSNMIKCWKHEKFLELISLFPGSRSVTSGRMSFKIDV